MKTALQIARSKVGAVEKSTGARNSTLAFSLIEVICAIMIVGLALVGLTRGIATALKASKESEVQTAAALIAAGRIEMIRADGFLMAGTEDGESGLPNYSWRQELTETGVEGLFEVTVNVLNTRSGKSIFELKTMLFEVPFEDTGVESKEDRKQQRDGRRAS